MRRCRIGTLVPVLLLTLLLGACGEDDDEGVGDLPPATDDQTESGEPEEEETEEPEPTATDEPAPETYEVQSGDTLWDIAQQFGTTVDAIVEANDIDDPDRIAPGDELVIPADG